MDPNANLQEQERLVTIPTYERKPHEHSRLRELRVALNGWLIKGGFEPDWTKAPKASRYFGQSHKPTGATE